jgi:hypothetical protein
MRKLAIFIFITLIHFASYAQDTNKEITKLIIAYKGDSTLFIEKYEIDIPDKQIYSITPIMNYLDVQGQKYRTRKIVNMQEWNDITSLIYAIDFKKLASCNLKDSDKVDYFVEIISNQSKMVEIKLSQGIVPIELRKIFKIIRST